MGDTHVWWHLLPDLTFNGIREETILSGKMKREKFHIKIFLEENMYTTLIKHSLMAHIGIAKKQVRILDLIHMMSFNQGEQINSVKHIQ